MAEPISFMAGKKALAIIRDEGLRSDRVRVVVGAAGGPKWLVLRGLDEALVTRFFRSRKEPLFLLGSSIGAWRFAAAAQRNAREAIARFETAYLEQRYDTFPTPAEVSAVSRRILEHYAGADGASHALSHPFIRLCVLADRSRHIFASESRAALGGGMAMAFLGNIITRGAMGLFFERTLFHDPRDTPPFSAASDFRTRTVPLSVENFHDAVMASGSIPMVMSGICGISGAPPGVYRDGGMIDYHPSFIFDPDPDRIVLYPHYTDRVVPGWLDKNIPWRKAPAATMDNALIVCPSRAFIADLPLRKIPDRGDFMKFRGRDDERLAYWNAVLSAGRDLGGAFIESVESGSIRDSVVSYG